MGHRHAAAISLVLMIVGFCTAPHEASGACGDDKRLRAETSVTRSFLGYRDKLVNLGQVATKSYRKDFLPLMNSVNAYTDIEISSFTGSGKGKAFAHVESLSCSGGSTGYSPCTWVNTSGKLKAKAQAWVCTTPTCFGFSGNSSFVSCAQQPLSVFGTPPAPPLDATFGSSASGDVTIDDAGDATFSGDLTLRIDGTDIGPGQRGSTSVSLNALDANDAPTTLGVVKLQYDGDTQTPSLHQRGVFAALPCGAITNTGPGVFVVSLSALTVNVASAALAGRNLAVESAADPPPLPAPAETPNKCVSGKIKLAAKKASALLACYRKGAAKGVAFDALCVQKAQAKFTAGSIKIDEKQDEAKPETLCPGGPGDESVMETEIDVHVDDVADDLDSGFPSFAASKCTAGKLKCVSKRDKCTLGVHSKGFQKGLPSDAAKLQMCEDKFDGGADPTRGCFAQLEAKGGCLTTGDTPALVAKTDAFVEHILDLYTASVPSPIPATRPTQFTFTGTSTTGVLDAGWTGQGHDSTVMSQGTVTVDVTSCANATAPFGVCTYTGPIATDDPCELQVQRCQNDSSVHCTVDADCSGVGGPCKFFFGTYLPLSAGGVSTCVENTFAGTISGTVDVDTGASEGTASVTSRVFHGPTLAQPCPQCAGDATANDGLADGVCSGGARSGLACDASGSSPNAAFGKTSLDCPPLAGDVIGALPIDLSTTTGTKTKTLSAASPNCSSISFPGTKCQCGTCDTPAAEPCATNADCPGTQVCGGKRCIGGANNGAPCTLTSACPAGICAASAVSTAPNQCDGGSGDCVIGDNSPATSASDHICSTGPFEQFCGPVETFRACTGTGDCPHPGDTCSVGRFRECFDNGIIGDTVSASGQASAPVNHEADVTVAALFCIAPTSSNAVNSAVGLPGLGRLELRRRVTDDGTP